MVRGHPFRHQLVVEHPPGALGLTLHAEVGCGQAERCEGGESGRLQDRLAFSGAHVHSPFALLVAPPITLPMLKLPMYSLVRANASSLLMPASFRAL